METRLNGFIIANRAWNAQTQLEMGMSSFGLTTAEAWRRHLGPERGERLDFPIHVQRWSDRGYGPVAVSVSVSPAPAHKEQAE